MNWAHRPPQTSKSEGEKEVGKIIPSSQLEGYDPLPSPLPLTSPTSQNNAIDCGVRCEATWDISLANPGDRIREYDFWWILTCNPGDFCRIVRFLFASHIAVGVIGKGGIEGLYARGESISTAGSRIYCSTSNQHVSVLSEIQGFGWIIIFLTFSKQLR